MGGNSLTSKFDNEYIIIVFIITMFIVIIQTKVHPQQLKSFTTTSCPFKNNRLVETIEN